MIEPVPFAQTKFLAMGIPDAKISLKPNFVDPDPGLGAGQGGYALFAGRLSPEKGIKTLLAAWKLLKTNVPLKIVGEGPLREEIKSSAEENPNIQWLGQKQRGEVLELMGEAAFLVFPSAWYETFGLSIIEAFSKGTPIIASRLGATENLVDLNRTGLFFKTDDAEDLAAKAAWLYSHPNMRAQMRRAARAEYEAKYTAERNYELLMDIYTEVLSQ